VARILVSLGVRGGLQKQFNMTDRRRTRTKIMDYEGVPFRCSHWNYYGHILKDFPLSFRGRADISSTTQFINRSGMPTSDGSIFVPPSTDHSCSSCRPHFTQQVEPASHEPSTSIGDLALVQFSVVARSEVYPPHGPRIFHPHGSFLGNETS